MEFPDVRAPAYLSLMEDTDMSHVGLLVRLEAKPEKAEELADFLKGALPGFGLNGLGPSGGLRDEAGRWSRVEWNSSLGS